MQKILKEEVKKNHELKQQIEELKKHQGQKIEANGPPVAVVEDGDGSAESNLSDW